MCQTCRNQVSIPRQENWMVAYRNTWMFLIHKLETLERLRMGSHSISSHAYVKHTENRQTWPDRNWTAAYRNTWMFLIHKLEIFQPRPTTPPPIIPTPLLLICITMSNPPIIPTTPIIRDSRVNINFFFNFSIYSRASPSVLYESFASTLSV